MCNSPGGKSGDGRWCLTFFLWAPLELQDHVVMADEGVHGAVEVQGAPQQQAVLPPQLGYHDRHQAVGERLAGRRV